MHHNLAAYLNHQVLHPMLLQHLCHAVASVAFGNSAEVEHHTIVGFLDDGAGPLADHLDLTVVDEAHQTIHLCL